MIRAEKKTPNADAARTLIFGVIAAIVIIVGLDFDVGADSGLLREHAEDHGESQFVRPGLPHTRHGCVEVGVEEPNPNWIHAPVVPFTLRHLETHP